MTATEHAEAPAVRGSLSRRLRDAAGLELVANVAALATLSTVIASTPSAVSAALGAITLLYLLFTSGLELREQKPAIRPTGEFVVARVLLVASAAAWTLRVSDARWWVPVAIGLLTIAEPTVSRIAAGAIPFGVNVKGIEFQNTPRLPAYLVFYVNTTAFISTSVFLGTSAYLVAVVPAFLLGAAYSAFVALDGILRIRARRGANAKITALLIEHSPAFVVHWDATPDTSYQLSRWLPYLDRLGEKYVVIIRNQATFAEVRTLTDQPILLRKILDDLDAVVVPSLKVAFYVNNGVKNSHLVRYPQLKHIQLNHGDSDKAPSYNPVFRMFDKNFVAGQAAIDRFAQNGIGTAPGFFEIVGRPQVESIQVGPRESAEGVPTVLYAPTWAGFHADSAYSSLPIGVLIVEALVKAGCTVIYRPHPYTDRVPSHAHASAAIKSLLAKDSVESGRAHLFGRVSEVDMTITDCFNAADSLISDVSSVVPDFLYSERPFAVCAMLGTIPEFLEVNPIAAGGYTISHDGANLDAAISGLLGGDPMYEKRSALKSYYLGDFPRESYAEAFLSAARRELAS